MSGKRQATTDLNHDNWDQAEEPQERGIFRKAPPEELKARTIKLATRRSAIANRQGDDAADTSSKSVFSGFSGFAKPTTAASGSTPFAFLSNISSASSTGKLPISSLNSKATDEETVASSTSAKESKRETSLSTNTGVSADCGNITEGATPTTSIFGNALVTKDAKPSPQPTGTILKLAAPAEKNESIIENSSEYRDNVAELNRAVMEFLQEHMAANPYCILTPVFDSYNEHARELLKDYKVKTNASTSLNTSSNAESTKTTTPLAPPTKEHTPEASATTSAPTHGYIFSKPNNKTATDTLSTPTTVSFGFGSVSGGTTTTAPTSFFSVGNVQNPLSTATKSEATSSTASTSDIFSLGKQPLTPAANKIQMPEKGSLFDDESASTAKGPSAQTSNGFTFGVKSDDKPRFGNFFNSNGIKMASSGDSTVESETGSEEQEEDCPPEVTFNKVVEEDAVFSIRCKVFGKKNDEFVERGTGTLYLKPVKDTEKMQMLVRADTNLGNILVNLILSKGLPCQRMGKNNVMMVCIPTPEESKPMSMLLRVKTAENADKLFEEIKKHTL